MALPEVVRPVRDYDRTSSLIFVFFLSLAVATRTIATADNIMSVSVAIPDNC